MTITAQRKLELVESFGQKSRDTGSTEVQVALLSERISLLSEHLTEHRKDLHSRMGLLKMLGQRRRLLNYLKGKSENRYQTVIKRLGLRR